MLNLENFTEEGITLYVREMLESYSCFIWIVNEEFIQEIVYKLQGALFSVFCVVRLFSRGFIQADCIPDLYGQASLIWKV